jgi:adenylate kinase family enzyme
LTGARVTRHQQAMHRIVVLGCAGVGKTTFARRLGERLAIPVICLDEIWRPQWGPSDVPAFRAMLHEAHQGEAWVSDGNFAKATFDMRLPRADLVIWLERPRWICAWRVIARTFRKGERHRLADVPKVLSYIWSFDAVNRRWIEDLLAEHGPHLSVVRLETPRAVERLLFDL